MTSKIFLTRILKYSTNPKFRWEKNLFFFSRNDCQSIWFQVIHFKNKNKMKNWSNNCLKNICRFLFDYYTCTPMLLLPLFDFFFYYSPFLEEKQTLILIFTFFWFSAPEWISNFLFYEARACRVGSVVSRSTVSFSLKNVILNLWWS